MESALYSSTEVAQLVNKICIHPFYKVFYFSQRNKICFGNSQIGFQPELNADWEPHEWQVF